MSVTTRRKRIIVVDDNPTNLTSCKNILKPFYEVFLVPSSEKMFELMERFLPDLILLDVEMPGINGYEAARMLKNNNDFKEVPIIFLTAKREAESEMEGLELGAVDYIMKPFVASILLRRIETHMSHTVHRKELREINASIHKRFMQKLGQVWTLQNSVLSIVADLVEFRDAVTGGHVARTQQYLSCLINKLIETDLYTEETSRWDLDFVLPSAQLHDVGKIGISDIILNKPGPLTPEEFDVVKTHVAIGMEAIDRMEQATGDHDFFYHAKLFAGTHHERWDGKGYPAGLKGEEIPLDGRLMALVDVYDALISERPYKPAYTPEAAAAIIKEGKGTQFDPQLVELFCLLEDQFAEIATAPPSWQNNLQKPV